MGNTICICICIQGVGSGRILDIANLLHINQSKVLISAVANHNPPPFQDQ